MEFKGLVVKLNTIHLWFCELKFPKTLLLVNYSNLLNQLPELYQKTISFNGLMAQVFKFFNIFLFTLKLILFICERKNKLFFVKQNYLNKDETNKQIQQLFKTW